jgi:hypothetical protein
MDPKDGVGEAIVADPFGVPAPQEAPVDDKAKDDKGAKDEGKQTPVQQLAQAMKELGELQALHGVKDENIAAMRNKLKEYESGKIKPKGEDGAPPASEAMFAEVKTSKDLTKEEREEMTEADIRTFDEMAMMKQGMNKMFEALQNTQKSTETVQETNVNETVRELALTAAGNDQTLANEIIENFNLFDASVRKGATKEKLAELVTKAALMKSGYKPPKEQGGAGGITPVKNNGAAGDPFGTDAIIAEARKGSDGKYTL